MPSQNVTINFAQGLNTKTDPWQIPIGQFEILENSIFQKGGLLQKRNGYGDLTSINPVSNYLTTLNRNLVSIGHTVSSYSESLDSWITKGTLQPCSLSVLPLIRNNVNQTQADSSISGGLVFTVYTQTHNTTSAQVTEYLYVIADADTGQNIVAPTAIPTLASGTITGSSRVFVLGTYFVVVSQVKVSTNTFLQYFSVPISNPVDITTNIPNASPAQDVTSEVYAPISSNPGWDGISVNSGSSGTLVVAYNSTAGGQGVHVATLTSQQVAANSASSIILPFTNAAYVGSLVSVCADLTTNPNLFYISFYNNNSQNIYTMAVTIGFGNITQAFAPTIIVGGLTIANLASAAQNGSAHIYAEVINSYAYDSSQPTNYIQMTPVSSAGTAGSTSVSIRSVGLASKAFIVNGSIYFLSSFQSQFQPSYFLINGSLSKASSPVVVSRLAVQNGSGYLSLGLPNVVISAGIASLPYLYKDDVEALNTLNNTQQLTAGGIYSQEGINLVSFDLETTDIDTIELANNLHISGGYLGQFDGYLPVEQNFFIWPEPIEVTYNATSTVTPTGNVSSGSSVISGVSSLTGVSPGMTITGTGIPASTSVLYASGSTIAISNVATASNTGVTLTIQGNIAAVPTGASTAGNGLYYYQAVYSWTDNQGYTHRSTPSIPVTFATTGTGVVGAVTINVPTLRLTAKVLNPVKIDIYRWSEFTQVYNQVTSITSPVLNSTTGDSVSFVDTLSDANVVGNNILYTTGGVVPDCNAPASSIMTDFDTRLWTVNPENPNELWVSKQVISGTPVEMSNLFTIYVAPNIGTTASTGGITAMAPMDDKNILFKKNAIYYINGVGPDNLGTTAVGCSLGNYSQPIFITSVVGCTNQKSIVLTQDGLMFQSDKGIWLLGRNLQTSYIGAAAEDYNDIPVNSANVIPQSNRVVFTLDNNQMLMYDYYFQQWGVFKGPYAVSSCIYNELHTILDKYGNILQETPGKYMDGPNPVLLGFKTGWINIASLQGYERFKEFMLLAKYVSPHSLLCQVAYDYNPSILNEKLISPKNFSPTTPGPFGVPTPFGSPGNVEQWRIHTKKQLCQSFQLSVTEVFDPSLGTLPGAGFTMSGISCKVDVKRATRPIRGSTSTGVG